MPSIPPAFNVSTVDVRLAGESRKMIQFIKIATRNEQPRREIQKVLKAGEGHQEQFHPPLVIDHEDHLILSVTWSSPRRKHNETTILVDPRLDVGCMREDQGIRSYRKKVRNIEVIVTGLRAGSPPEPASGELVPTTAQLINRCPRFRILIIGNSGVGKSSLIHKVFGVQNVHVSDATRGAAEINREFISSTNERFVIHDSLGFESGDNQNLEKVNNFISHRQAKPRLADQLHAIWLCIEIPRASGRLLEDGVEKFLADRRKIPGGVPIVVVLTKLDLLVNRLEMEYEEEEDAEADEDSNRRLEQRKTTFLNDVCIHPILQAAGGEVPHIAVSTADDYSESLSELIKVTKESMTELQVDEASVVAASIAQRVNLKDKIELSIAIGKKKYWSTLMKSAVFQGHTLKECLEVIRTDIANVWNIDDPNQYLTSGDVSGALLRTDNLGESTSRTQMDTPSLSQSISGLVTALSASGEPTLAIVAPVAGMAIWIVKLAYEMYNSSKQAVMTLMAYIVHLTCIMQVMFILASDRQVSLEMVNQAIRAYENHKPAVDKEVKVFDTKFAVLTGGGDLVFNEIEALIWRHSLGEHEVEGLRRRVASVLQPATVS